MGKLRLRGSRDLAKVTRPEPGLLSAWPAPPYSIAATDSQLTVSFPGSLETESSWLFPRIRALSCVCLSSGGHPWSEGCRQACIHTPSQLSALCLRWQTRFPPPTGLHLPRSKAAGPASALPEQRPWNSPGPFHLRRQCLPRKQRP